jgi:NADH-quinone oxidoreductase subunit C
MMSEALTELSSTIGEAAAGKVLASEIANGELTLTTDPESVIGLLTFLHDDPRCAFVALTDISGVDWPAREKRFDVVYQLLSPSRNLRIRVKLQVAEDAAVPSATSVYRGAEWYERETWDLFGIPFDGHADLRRLLTDYGFEGHPLRKDFPTTGFVEVRYDDSAKRVVYEPVKLRQEFRNFDFLSPWEGPEYVLPGDEKANG